MPKKMCVFEYFLSRTTNSPYDHDMTNKSGKLYNGKTFVIIDNFIICLGSEFMFLSIKRKSFFFTIKWKSKHFSHSSFFLFWFCDNIWVFKVYIERVWVWNVKKINLNYWQIFIQTLKTCCDFVFVASVSEHLYGLFTVFFLWWQSLFLRYIMRGDRQKIISDNDENSI